MPISSRATSNRADRLKTPDAAAEATPAAEPAIQPRRSRFGGAPGSAEADFNATFGRDAGDEEAVEERGVEPNPAEDSASTEDEPPQNAPAPGESDAPTNEVAADADDAPEAAARKPRKPRADKGVPRPTAPVLDMPPEQMTATEIKARLRDIELQVGAVKRQHADELTVLAKEFAVLSVALSKALIA